MLDNIINVIYFRVVLRPHNILLRSNTWIQRQIHHHLRRESYPSRHRATHHSLRWNTWEQGRETRQLIYVHQHPQLVGVKLRHASEYILQLIRVHQNLFHGIGWILRVLKAVLIIVVVIVVVVVFIVMLLDPWNRLMLIYFWRLSILFLILLGLFGNLIYLWLDLQLLENVIIWLRYFLLRLLYSHSFMSWWYTANQMSLRVKSGRLLRWLCLILKQIWGREQICSRSSWHWWGNFRRSWLLRRVS